MFDELGDHIEPEDPCETCSFDPSEVRPWVSKLKEQRCLVIVSPSSLIAQDALWSLLSHDAMPQLIPRRIAEDTHFQIERIPRVADTDESDVVYLAERFRALPLGQQQRHGGLANTDERDHGHHATQPDKTPLRRARRPDLHDQLADVKTRMSLSYLRRELQARKRFLVVLATPLSLTNLFGSSEHFDRAGLCWRVPFLERLLRHRCDTPEQATALRGRLQAQVGAGLWPADETAFCEELRHYRDAKSLEQAMAEQEKAYQLPELSRLPEALREAALWTAAHLPELPDEDYQQVLELLIEGESAEVPAAALPGDSVKAVRDDHGSPTEFTISVPSATQDTSDDERQEVTVRIQRGSGPRPNATGVTQVTRLLVDIWDDDYRRIMPALNLSFEEGRSKTAGGEDGSPVCVVFAPPHVRDKVQRYFRSTLRRHHSRYVRRLEESDLLLNSSWPIVRAVVGIIISAARERPQRGMLRLARLLDASQTMLRAAAPLAGTHNSALAMKAIDVGEKIFDRLGMLLVEMHAEPTLRPVVLQFLKQLCDTDQNDDLTQIYAFELILRLSTFAVDFDTFNWLRKLLVAITDSLPSTPPLQLLQLDTATAAVLRRATELLCKRLRHHGLVEHLAVLEQWVDSRSDLETAHADGDEQVRPARPLAPTPVDDPIEPVAENPGAAASHDDPANPVGAPGAARDSQAPASVDSDDPIHAAPAGGAAEQQPARQGGPVRASRAESSRGRSGNARAGVLKRRVTDVAGHLALLALIHELSASVSEQLLGEDPCWPPDNDILKNLWLAAETDSDAFERLAKLVLHEDYRRLVRDCDDVASNDGYTRDGDGMARDPAGQIVGKERALALHLGSILAAWAVALQGHRDLPHPEGAALLRRIIEPIAAAMSASLMKQVVDRWQALDQAYAEKISIITRHRPTSRGQRAHQRHERTRQIGARRRLKELSHQLTQHWRRSRVA